MSLAKIIMIARLMFLVALWLSVSNTNCAQKQEVYGDGISPPNACVNCSICPYPCHPRPPPPPLGGPSDGLPAPSPPTGVANCPQAPLQCCQYSPPRPYTYVPYNNYSASLPLAFNAKPHCTISSATFLMFLFEFVLWV